METGCRRRNRPGFSGENGLVARLIFCITHAADVRRQWHRAAGVNIDISVEDDNPSALRYDLFDARRYAIDDGRTTRAHFAARFDQAFPASWSKLLQEQEFDRAVIGKSPGGQNTRVVENEQIAQSQEAF